MTTVLVGVQDGKFQKIPNATVVIKDKTTGFTQGSGVTGEQGEASIGGWLGTPFGTYRATATTPRGVVGTVEFSLDWLASDRNVVVNVSGSDEGNWWATFLSNFGAAWNSVAWMAGPVLIVAGAYVVVTRGPGLVDWVVGKAEGRQPPPEKAEV